MVLGMHDALVSLTGIIVGLTFALADSRLIILTSVIASVSAALSMTASNYLAQRANGDSRAITAGLYTGAAYLLTSALLILPFTVFANQLVALAATFCISFLIIFGFNYCAYHLRKQPFIKRFLEMLGICFCVSIIAFAIGFIAK